MKVWWVTAISVVLPQCTDGGIAKVVRSLAVCADESCLARRCSNGVLDGDEGDVDCGGSCAACAPEKRCGSGGDCDSRSCVQGVCAQASCFDGVANQDEVDVDCGGSCGTKCGVGAACIKPEDCETQLCTEGQCRDARCGNGVRDGRETGLDCGGPTCPACTTGQGCLADSDCVLGASAIVPSGCAQAACLPSQVCGAKAIDADGDGHRTNGCQVDNATLEGDDCDDENTTIHAGAWDGPATAESADACDTVDNDCNLKVDDAKVPGTGVKCSCVPGRVCAASNWSVANGNVGACKLGVVVCADDAFLRCDGAVGPKARDCNQNADLDCNGVIDLSEPRNEIIADGDRDGHCVAGAAPEYVCAGATVPSTHRLASACVDQTDCAPGDATRWRMISQLTDSDADGYCVAPSAESCEGVGRTCAANPDCNDTNAQYLNCGVFVYDVVRECSNQSHQSSVSVTIADARAPSGAVLQSLKAYGPSPAGVTCTVSSPCSGNDRYCYGSTQCPNASGSCRFRLQFSLP